MSSIGSRFGMAVHKKPEACPDLILPFAKVGVEIECERVRLPADRQPLLSYWDNHVDQSLRNNGMEFTTKGGLVGKSLTKAVRDICKWLKDNKCDEGYPRAGIHLHIDVTDLNEDNDTELANLTMAYMLFETAIFKWAEEGKDRWCRESCGFCDPLTTSNRDYQHIAELLYNWNGNKIRLDANNFSKYQAVNFLPLAKFGTLEFRQLPTTFDAERIITWTNLCLSFKAFAQNVNVDPIDYMESRGLDALMHTVFGKHVADIARYVDKKEVMENAVVARALRIRKRNKPVLESWDPPDNPLLLKKSKKKPVAKKEQAPAEPPRINAQPRGVINVAAQAAAARGLQWQLELQQRARERQRQENNR